MSTRIQRGKYFCSHCNRGLQESTTTYTDKHGNQRTKKELITCTVCGGMWERDV